VALVAQLEAHVATDLVEPVAMVVAACTGGDGQVMAVEAARRADPARSRPNGDLTAVHAARNVHLLIAHVFDYGSLGA
jgi:hypothetical protein